MIILSREAIEVPRSIFDEPGYVEYGPGPITITRTKRNNMTESDFDKNPRSKKPFLDEAAIHRIDWECKCKAIMNIEVRIDTEQHIECPDCREINTVLYTPAMYEREMRMRNKTTLSGIPGDSPSTMDLSECDECGHRFVLDHVPFGVARCPKCDSPMSIMPISPGDIPIPKTVWEEFRGWDDDLIREAFEECQKLRGTDVSGKEMNGEIHFWLNRLVYGLKKKNKFTTAEISITDIGSKPGKRIKDLRNPAHKHLYPIFKYFSYDHLPEHLQELSKPFQEIAARMINKSTPGAGPEIAEGLRKLLEAKDCFVRSGIK